MIQYFRDTMLEIDIECYKDYKSSIIKRSLRSFKGASENLLYTSMSSSKIINTTKIYPRSFLQWIDILTTKFINNMGPSND
jgi:hypothetical protein